MKNLNLYYDKREIEIFLNILETIIRSENEGECVINGSILKIKIEVENE
jgi:hypothetical protein